jgi:hypothetical protein
MKERTIFKSYLFWTLEEEKEQKQAIKEMLEEDAICNGEEFDVSDERINDRFYDDLNMFYDDARLNLNKLLPNNIIALGEVGVWTGNYRGGKVLGNNLNDILYSGDCDDISVTYDGFNVHSVLAHHDGRHHMTYRMVKEGYDADDLLNKYVYEGKDIMRYTTSLVPYIKKIYGC